MLSDIPEIKELKEFLLTDDNKIQTKKIVYKWLQTRCPLLIKYFDEHYSKEDFRGFIYLILNNQDPIIPVCPICGNKLTLENFVKGFHTTCSKKCAGKLYTQNKEVHQRISETKQKQQLKKDKWLYDYDIISNKNNTTFKNYCIHGDVTIYNKVMHKIYNIGQSTFCLKCNEVLFNTYNPTDEEIQQVINDFPEFHKQNANALKWDFWMRYYTKMLKCLVVYFEQHIHKIFNPDMLPEVYYVALHKLEKPLYCPVCNKPITRFFNSSRCYATHCDEHLFGYNNVSTTEQEFIDFIKTLNANIITSERTILNGQEIDVYIPNKKVGFEFNGCYWHSSASKDKTYHMKKKELAKQNGIDLFFIWDDEWNYKKDIVKSLVKSKLGIFDKRIGARLCEIRTVNYNDALEFINNNHLQGYAICTVKLGLYYNDELVAMMTFGKSRFKSNDMEIIRYCTKLNYQIIGGPSKLFSYFKKSYLGNNNCVSYAFADISNGNMYKQLGMKEISITENWAWLHNGIRYNRLNKIHKEHDNLLKCYSSGIIKYSLE